MSRKVTTEDFIRRAQEIHGDKYDYSKTVYERNNEAVAIICPEHGLFMQRANNHLNGRGCVECGKTRMGKKSPNRKLSKYKGVHWCESQKRWRVSLCIDGEVKIIKSFKEGDEDLAGQYYIQEKNRLKPPLAIPDLNGETWIDFNIKKGLYSVSNKGRIKSYDYRGSGDTVLLLQQINPFGYYTIVLQKRTYFVHDLVAQYFIGRSDMFVNHKDGNKLNNDVNNLEFVTNRSNVCHALIARGKFPGATLRKRDGYYVTELKVGDRRVWLGASEDPTVATQRYLDGLRKYGLMDDYNYIFDLLKNAGF